MEDDKILAEAQGEDPDANKEEGHSDSPEEEILAGSLTLKGARRLRSARLRQMSISVKVRRAKRPLMTEVPPGGYKHL
jgi:hypothetical protein